MIVTMTKFNIFFKFILIFGLSLVLQSCSIPQYWFMVSNTNSGNVCVEELELAVSDPYAQTVAKILYARYGSNGGERTMYSNSVSNSSSCIYAESIYDGIPKANLIISVEFYKEVIEPEYLGTAPEPATNTTF